MKKTTLVFDREVVRFLQANRDPNRTWRQTAVQNPDGTFSVPVDDDIRECLESDRQPGEDDSAVFRRMMGERGITIPKVRPN